jgi:hypothetical protein
MPVARLGLTVAGGGRSGAPACGPGVNPAALRLHSTQESQMTHPMDVADVEDLGQPVLRGLFDPRTRAAACRAAA